MRPTVALAGGNSGLTFDRIDWNNQSSLSQIGALKD